MKTYCHSTMWDSSITSQLVGFQESCGRLSGYFWEIICSCPIFRWFPERADIRGCVGTEHWGWCQEECWEAAEILGWGSGDLQTGQWWQGGGWQSSTISSKGTWTLSCHYIKHLFSLYFLQAIWRFGKTRFLLAASLAVSSMVFQFIGPVSGSLSLWK